MAWAKIDDQFHSHPKVLAAWQADPRAIGLHSLALASCASYLTDGVVSDAFVRQFLPSPKARERVTSALVDAGLWEVDNADGCWRIHDYLDYNPSRERVEQKRAGWAERQKKSRDVTA